MAEKVLAGHGVQLAEPTAALAKRPGGQREQKTALPSVARPAVQLVQEALALVLATLPEGQMRHWLVSEAAYVPGKQAVQLDTEEEARGETLPGGHLLQKLASGEPGLGL